MTKSKFVIYNYTFSRIIEPNQQMQLEFPDWTEINVEESFKHRQQVLQEILCGDYDKSLQFVNAHGKEYWHKQIVKPQDDVYVMRVANVTNVTIIDENLKDNKYKDYRNCLVVIDNRPGIQRIAIEKKSKAFSDSKTVARILEASFCKFLRYKLLKVTLFAVYGTNVFWSTVKEYPQGFKKIVFHFPHLNLERLTNTMEKYLSLVRADWDSDLSFSLGANEGGIVKIDKNNERQNALINGASGAGTWIKMYPKNSKRRFVSCGKDEFVIQEIDSVIFDKIQGEDPVIPGIGESSMDKLKIFMKNIPEAFNTSVLNDDPVS